MRQLQFDNSQSFAVLHRWGMCDARDFEPVTYDGYLLDDHVFVAKPNPSSNAAWRILIYPWGLSASHDCNSEAMALQIAEGICALKLDWPKLMQLPQDHPEYRAAIKQINEWVHDYFERDFEFVPMYTYVGKPLG